MTLTELKEYVHGAAHCLRTGNRNAFPVEPSVIEPMARRWIDKGLWPKSIWTEPNAEAAQPARTVSNVTTNGSVLNR